MQLSPLLVLLALLLVPLAWGPAPGGLLSPRCRAAGASLGECGSCPEHQDVKPGSEFPWIMAYVPMRSCHRVLRDAYGEFSPPAYHGDSPVNFWCNWTVWAGSRKHIIIYIQGFITKEGCNRNEDKILFEGVSSLVEDGVVYACWKKETHVFATFAQAVHVVLLKRYLPRCRDLQFKGKYYIFQDQDGESSSKDALIPETLAPMLPKQGSIFQSRWADDFRGVLGFATTHSTESFKTVVLSGGSLQGGGTTAVGSPAELVPYQGAKMGLLETKAARVLGSEPWAGLRLCKEDQGGGTAGGVIPTAALGTWRQSPTTSGDITLGFGDRHGFSSVLLETPLLGALQVAEPFLQPAGVGWESRQPVLHPTLRLKDLGGPQLTIKPTHTSHGDSAARSQALSPGRRESKDGVDTTTCQGLGTAGLEKDKSRAQLSIPADGAASSDADGLAKGLMPSLSSPYEVVNRDGSQLLPERSQSSSRGLSMTQPNLGTTSFQHGKLMGTSPLESSRGVVEGKTVLCPTTLRDILQEHPHLRGHSSHFLQAAGPWILPTRARAHDRPAAEKAPVSSLVTKSCCHQSHTAVQPGLVAPALPTGLEPAPTVTSTLRTEAIPMPALSHPDHVPADFGCSNLAPEEPLPSEAEPVSRAVFSPPAALDLDPFSFRQRAGISPASPGGQEIGKVVTGRHPSAAPELGTEVSPVHLGSGMSKLVLEEGGQQGETPAPAGLPARGPSPASIPSLRAPVGHPCPQDQVSRGSGVAPASLPGTQGVRREEPMALPQHPGTAASNKLASASLLGGFKMQKTTDGLHVGAGEQRNASSVPAHSSPPVAPWGQTALRGQELQEPSNDPVSRNTWMPGGQQQEHAELGLPWAMEYLPVRSCHIVLQDGFGVFYLPSHGDIKANIWCNWTIWAGPQKHVLIYVQGFQGSEGCGKNQDKMIFQGVLSSVETKVVYACHNRGTLIFATKATVVYVLLLSRSGSLSSDYKHFKGQYYIFGDYEAVGSSNDAIDPGEPVQEISKKESWRTEVTKGLQPMLRASPSPPAMPPADRIQPELVSSDEMGQHLPDLVEDAQPGANLGEQGELQDETEMERSLKDGGSEGRESNDVLVAPASGDAGCKAEPPVLEVAKGGVGPVSALVTVAPRRSAGVPSSEVPSSNVGLPGKLSNLCQARDILSAEVVTTHHLQMPALEKPPLNMSTKPSLLYPSPGVTAGDTVSPGERHEDLFDLASVLVSLENGTALRSLHHPGDVLFEVTTEVKHKDWIPPGGSELRKNLLESVKNYIQQNLKLSANRVNEIKLKEVKRTSNASLLLTFWLHLKPEERNVSLLLRSQLEELLGASVGVEKLQLVSLLVEDVNECSSGVSLCGEEAECFNGVGTYLCRCKKDYEDHSPMKSGTLCVRAPPSGMGFLLRHADLLVGAAIMASLAMLVAAGALCRAKWRGRPPRRDLAPEEPPERAVEEPVMELQDLGDCLRLDPFQLKLRARPPEWLWDARAHPGQAYRVFLEQSPPL